MQTPTATATCTYCGRTRDCMMHTRDPVAAAKWLKKTCKHEEKPCAFTYRAGELVQKRRMQ